jgi:hypothetical protein
VDPRHFGMGSETGSCFFRQWQTRKPTKNKFFLKDLLLITLKEIKVFLYFFAF